MRGRLWSLNHGWYLTSQWKKWCLGLQWIVLGCPKQPDIVSLKPRHTETSQEWAWSGEGCPANTNSISDQVKSQTERSTNALISLMTDRMYSECCGSFIIFATYVTWSLRATTWHRQVQQQNRCALWSSCKRLQWDICCSSLCLCLSARDLSGFRGLKAPLCYQFPFTRVSKWIMGLPTWQRTDSKMVELCALALNKMLGAVTRTTAYRHPEKNQTILPCIPHWTFLPTTASFAPPVRHNHLPCPTKKQYML